MNVVESRLLDGRIFEDLGFAILVKKKKKKNKVAVVFNGICHVLVFSVIFCYMLAVTDTL